MTREQEQAPQAVARTPAVKPAPPAEAGSPSLEKSAPEADTALPQEQTAPAASSREIPRREPSTPTQDRKVPEPRTQASEPEVASRLGRTSERPPQVPQEEPQAPSADRRSGWTCRPGEAGKEWNCSLVGDDPRGQPRPVTADGGNVKNWQEAGNITTADERRFRDVISLLPADPWQNVCAVTGKREAAPMTEFLLSSKERAAREKAPLDIHSDYFEMLDNELANFRGSAELVRGDQKLWADFVTHDTVTDAMNARGNMIYQEKGMTFSGDSGFLDMDDDRGTFRNSQFILATVPARGTARVTHLDNDKLSRYETFTYTSCPPGNQDWVLHASRVKINKDTGQGSATNAWMEFKGVPFFYFPYMSFPIDDRRQTGFLSPSFGTTKVGGFDLSAPYYLNLAPNYDFTFTPRYLTKRGPLFRGEFRYLSSWTRGRVMAEYMPEDQVKGTPRGQGGFLNDTQILPNLRSHINANYVSDARYPRELGNPLNLTSYLYVPSQANINYNLGSFNVRADATYYQVIDPSLQVPRYPQNATEELIKRQRLGNYPYYVLPRVTASYTQGLWDTGLLFESTATMANFQNDGNRPEGQRMTVIPKISYPYTTSYGFVTPSLTLHHSQYWMNYSTSNGPKEISRTLPIASLDMGTTFERELEWGGSTLLQTLEPRFFYVYIPNKNQNSIPLFDTGSYDFTSYQLFRENRFSGNDRLGDANQATVALTSRLIDQSSGLERLRLTLGEIFYFSPQNVAPYYKYDTNSLGTKPPTINQQAFSNFVADTYVGVTENWSMRLGGQWNPERNRAERGILALQYNDRENHLFNLAYRYRRDPLLDGARETCNSTATGPNRLACFNNIIDNTLSVADASARIPIFKGWNLIGRWQYSVKDQLTTETFAGIERETCCWRFTLLARRYINNFRPSANANNADLQYNNGIFLQLEFKGLTRLGDQVDQFLERSISGYRTDDF